MPCFAWLAWAGIFPVSAFVAKGGNCHHLFFRLSTMNEQEVLRSFTWCKRKKKTQPISPWPPETGPVNTWQTVNSTPPFSLPHNQTEPDKEGNLCTRTPVVFAHWRVNGQCLHAHAFFCPSFQTGPSEAFVFFPLRKCCSWQIPRRVCFSFAWKTAARHFFRGASSHGSQSRAAWACFRFFFLQGRGETSESSLCFPPGTRNLLST